MGAEGERESDGGHEIYFNFWKDYYSVFIRLVVCPAGVVSSAITESTSLSNPDASGSDYSPLTPLASGPRSDGVGLRPTVPTHWSKREAVSSIIIEQSVIAELL